MSKKNDIYIKHFMHKQWLWEALHLQNSYISMLYTASDHMLIPNIDFPHAKITSTNKYICLMETK